MVQFCSISHPAYLDAYTHSSPLGYGAGLGQDTWTRTSLSSSRSTARRRRARRICVGVFFLSANVRFRALEDSGDALERRCVPLPGTHESVTGKSSVDAGALISLPSPLRRSLRTPLWKITRLFPSQLQLSPLCQRREFRTWQQARTLQGTVHASGFCCKCRTARTARPVELLADLDARTVENDRHGSQANLAPEQHFYHWESTVHRRQVDPLGRAARCSLNWLVHTLHYHVAFVPVYASIWRSRADLVVTAEHEGSVEEWPRGRMPFSLYFYRTKTDPRQDLQERMYHILQVYFEAGREQPLRSLSACGSCCST